MEIKDITLNRRDFIKILIGIAVASGIGYYLYKLLSKHEPYFQIYLENGVANAYNVREKSVDYQDSDHYSVIQYALDHLPSRKEKEKKEKEKVYLKGDFISRYTIKIPSFTIFELEGSISIGTSDILNNGADYDLIVIENQSDIDIIGGELIGKGSNNGITGWGIRTLGDGLQNNNILISGVSAHGFRKSGIAINKSEFGCIVENCRCENNGLNGIGFGDAYYFTATNNYCKGNLDTGLNIEDGWDFKLVDNTCMQNTRHNLQLEHAVRGKVIRGKYVNSKQLFGISIRNRALKGRENEKSQEVDIIDVFVDSNALSGLVINSSERINILGGTFKNNGQKNPDDGIRIIDDKINLSLNNSVQNAQCYDDQRNKTQNYGIRELSGDHNTIINNIVKNNINSGIKTVGSNTIVKSNIFL